MEPNDLGNGQPMVSEVPNNKMDEKDRNAIIIRGIFGAVIVLEIIGIILALILGVGKHNNTSNTTIDSPAAEIAPSLELARSVCEGRGGEFVEDESFDSESFSELYTCQRPIENGADYGAFMFQIEFLKEGKGDEYWSEIRNKLKTTGPQYDVSAPIIVEDSDELIMFYSVVGGLVRYYSVLYKDVMISIASLISGYDSIVGDVLVELGFPERVKNEPYNNTVKIDYGDIYDGGADEFDIDANYLSDTYSLAGVFRQYQGNNYGKLPAIEDDTVYAIDEYMEEDDFTDPKTGNKYTIRAFADFAETPYAADDSELSKIESDEMYVFYKATCENDKIVKKDSSKWLAIIHATSDNTGYICNGN